MIHTTELLGRSVVVFSQNYLPLSRVNIRRAIALMLSGKAEPLLFGEAKLWQVHSPNLVLTVPNQIRLLKAGTERVWKVPSVSRRELLRRDRHTCQYCGYTKQLTIDHVLPLSKGGKHTWDNVVIACAPCNQRKGDRTPHQAGMPLKTKPKAPMHPAVAFADQFWQTQHPPLE